MKSFIFGVVWRREIIYESSLSSSQLGRMLNYGVSRGSSERFHLIAGAFALGTFVTFTFQPILVDSHLLLDL